MFCFLHCLFIHNYTVNFGIAWELSNTLSIFSIEKTMAVKTLGTVKHITQNIIAFLKSVPTKTLL